MNPIIDHYRAMTRRHFFSQGALGLGGAALASLIGSEKALGGSGQSHAVPEQLQHFAPKAKRAIYLFMAGAPSQIDTLDYKPKLEPLFDTDLPESVRQGQRLTTMTSGQSRFPLAPSLGGSRPRKASPEKVAMIGKRRHTAGHETTGLRARSPLFGLFSYCICGPGPNGRRRHQ